MPRLRLMRQITPSRTCASRLSPFICEDVTFFEIVFGARFHQRLPVFLRKSAYGHDWDIGRDAVVFQAR